MLVSLADMKDWLSIETEEIRITANNKNLISKYPLWKMLTCLLNLLKKDVNNRFWVE